MQLPPHLRVQVVDADRAYRSQDYATARNKLDPIITQYPNAPESAEAFYLMALCDIRQQRYADARGRLARCLSLSKRRDLTARAHAALGNVLFESGSYPEAAAQFSEALRDLPEVPPADEVRLRYGICMQRTGKWDEARSAFSAVLHQYPNTSAATEARRRFSWTRNFFSIQCGAFYEASAAEQLVRKLRPLMSETWKEPEARFGRPMFVVYAGKYPTLAEAQEGLRSARRSVPGAFIVP